MNQENRQRVRRVFMEIAELPAENRAAALDRACEGEPTLRAEVEALLAAEARAGGFMGSPTADAAAPGPAAATLAAPLREGPGTRIGPYKILQQIGEGGFGSVFMAEQEKPVSRRVALKIIKLGMDTRQVVARFEQERQALAMMDHPNIAKVFDAGATETGRPFFVMELVRGDPITEYCDKNILSTTDRLGLFTQVCHAVQHAHQKGIIHRDIKPSNVLITVADGKPIPKVIDFGIAKATASKLTEKTLFTEHRALIGTPEYMSPEQAEMSGVDIDTRSDIYSLGVLLYELLTGVTPFDGKQLRSAAYAEIQRIIREVEPPKPSTRVSTLGETLASTAAHRHTEPKRLSAMIRGDLDWIVMKALEKDRTRRYETANGLAADVRRHLAGEAVVAAPPSSAYRMRKFARRNKGPMLAAGAVAAALLVGAVAFAWQASVAGNQRDLAVQAQQAETEQRQLAEKSAAIAEAVATFQTDMLAAVDPGQLPRDPVSGEPLKDTVTVVQAMAAAVKALDEGSLKDQPLVEARVRATIGTTLRSLARYAEAEPNLRKSLALRRAALPAGHPDIADGLTNLAALLRNQNKLAEAEPHYREAIEIYRAVLPARPTDIASSLNSLASLLKAQNKPAEAEQLFRESLEMNRAALPAGHPDIAAGLNNLALLLRDQHKLAEAEPLFRESLAIIRAALPAGHPNIATGLGNLAELLRDQNKLAEAEPLYREALEIYRAALPAGHPDIATGMSSLAGFLMAQHKLAEAEPLYRESLAIRRAALPAGHPTIAMGLNNLALLLMNQNKLAEAEPLYREALEIVRAALPIGHPIIAAALINLANLLTNQGQLAEAEPLFLESLAIYRAALPAGHPNVLTVQRHVATLHAAMGRTNEALPLLRELLESSRATLPKDSPELAGQLASCSQTLLTLKAWDEAEPLIRECLAIREEMMPDDWLTFNARSMLGGVLLGQNNLAEAEPLLVEGYIGIKEREAAINPVVRSIRISEALERLVKLYEAWDKADPGKGYDAQAAEWRAQLEAAKAAPDAPPMSDKH